MAQGPSTVTQLLSVVYASLTKSMWTFGSIWLILAASPLSLDYNLRLVSL